MKADDSSLDPEDLLVVEERAKALLDRAAAWSVFPTPVEEILAAAKLRTAPTSAFDPKAILAYIKNAGADAGRWLKSAISKVRGIYDADEHVIHIDDTVVEAKKTFLKLHETGHHELPTHRKVFRWFQDCDQTLAPEISDRFEREANNFARYVLFQGDGFASMTADHPFGLKTARTVGKKFGASVYASTREYARSSHRPCIVYALERIEFVEGAGVRAAVRRIEPSPSFEKQFGRPTEQYITLDHPLGPVLPIGKRVTKPRSLVLVDLNGERHECLAEAFDTTYQILILVWPVKALTASAVILPVAAF